MKKILLRTSERGERDGNRKEESEKERMLCFVMSILFSLRITVSTYYHLKISLLTVNVYIGHISRVTIRFYHKRKP